jgi:photosystem II stability/assembly factor-like uncharacterized protein
MTDRSMADGNDLDHALSEYYRDIWDLAAQRGRTWDASVFTRRRHRSVASTTMAAGRLAAAIAIAAAVVGIVLMTRPASAPGGVSPATASTPSAAAVVPGQASAPVSSARVDRAGLTRTGGLWVTTGSTLLTSTDNGATWRSGTFPTLTGTGVEPVVDVFVLDPDHAWLVTLAEPVDTTTTLVGHAALSVERTEDGGKTWQQVTAPPGCTYPTATVDFVDQANGYLICSDSGVIAATHDGGASWSIAGTCQNLGSYLQASDATTIWSATAQTVVGPGTVLVVSRDGGRTCQDVTLPGLDGIPSNATLSVRGSPRFTDASHGLVTVSVSRPMQLPTLEFFTTSDAGRTWDVTTRQDPQLGSAPDVAQVHDNSRLVAVSVSHISTSVDNGASWQDFDAAGLPPNQPFAWIGFTDQTHGAAMAFMSQGSEELLLSSDGGRTWHPADLGHATN